MHVCQSCRTPFSADVPAWGDAACGDCIAARLELLLMGGEAARIRRPMRRAGDLPALTGNSVGVPGKKRSFG